MSAMTDTPTLYREARADEQATHILRPAGGRFPEVGMVSVEPDVTTERRYRLVVTDHEGIEPVGWEFYLGRMHPHISSAVGWMIPVEPNLAAAWDAFCKHSEYDEYEGTHVDELGVQAAVRAAYGADDE